MTNKGLLSSLALASTLATGFVVVWGLLGFWAVEVGKYVTRPKEKNESLFIQPDGAVFVYSSTDKNNEVIWRDLDGRECPPPAIPVTYSYASWLPARLPAPADNPAWEHRIGVFLDGSAPVVYWYFVSDGRANGSAYFVGYHSESNQRIGYLGRAGFRQGSLPSEELFPFTGLTLGESSRLISLQGLLRPGPQVIRKQPKGAVSGWDVYIHGLDNKIYHADLHERIVHVA